MPEIQPTFFEGSEKKVELIIQKSQPSLRGRGDAFWSRICGATGSAILSRITGERATAYLLSESSLLVFDHKLIMITCGCTTLQDGVVELLGSVPPEAVELCVYQRKNETYPHRQPTSFFQDVSAIHERLPGRAYRFGHEDEHHLYLFHLDRAFDSDPRDVTVEVLMYGLDDAVRTEFDRRRNLATAAVRERTGVDRILPGFAVDDHLFEPTGYSLNAIRGESYYTVHVTPEEAGSYASFETNHHFGRDLEGLVPRVLEIFRPRAFDLVVFDHGSELEVLELGYRPTSHVVERLACGYQVRFVSYHRAQSVPAAAAELPLEALRLTEVES